MDWQERHTKVMIKLTANVDAEKYCFASGEAVPFQDVVAVEHRLRLCVPVAGAMEFICTPEDLKSLVLGRLYTHGLISRRADVVEIVFNGGMTEAKAVLSGCAGARRQPAPLAGGSCDMSRVQTLVETFSHRDALFQETGAAHSCLIAVGDEVRYRTRDIGRHNAIDKAVGMALADGVDFSGCVLLTSGRVLSEIAEKVVMAGIPVLVARSAPTQLAVELARRYGMKLLGFASQKQCNIYT